ncbi:hypothetical protein BGX29_000197 [Mortierella sp. GBA35]|nr:hypothetical protein BGX29_000197 [Mortierella sp. GBA35]
MAESPSESLFGYAKFMEWWSNQALDDTNINQDPFLKPELSATGLAAFIKKTRLPTVDKKIIEAVTTLRALRSLRIDAVVEKDEGSEGVKETDEVRATQDLKIDLRLPFQALAGLEELLMAGNCYQSHPPTTTTPVDQEAGPPWAM